MATETSVREFEENQQILGVMLVLHGAVHFIGFALSVRMFEVGDFSYDDVWPAAGSGPAWVAGFAWLAAGVWVAVMGTRLALRRPPRRPLFAAAMAASALVTLLAAPAALAGTAISLAILASIGLLQLRRRQPADATG